MTGPHPATATIRGAVRATLAEAAPGDLVLAAVSGGADSMALAAALAVEAPPAGLRAGFITVDHGIQPGSAEVATRVIEWCRGLGLDPAIRIDVNFEGAHANLEATARAVRHQAFDQVCADQGVRLLLLGHTLDDQAEQVLLGLARGSGARSLSGMPSARGPLRRPLLGITREQTRASARAEGLPVWEDPMNDDPAYTRVRARRALADLEGDLGPGFAAALARSAAQLRVDADHLDGLADLEVAALGGGPWAASELAALPEALRGRVWRRLLIAAGSPAGQLASVHTEACDRLLTHWHGQGPLHVPGDLRVSREAGRVHISGPGRVE